MPLVVLIDNTLTLFEIFAQIILVRKIYFGHDKVVLFGVRCVGAVGEICKGGFIRRLCSRAILFDPPLYC